MAHWIIFQMAKSEVILKSWMMNLTAILRLNLKTIEALMTVKAPHSQVMRMNLQLMLLVKM